MFSESPRFRQNQNNLHKSPLCYDVLTRKDCDFSCFYAVTRTVHTVIHGKLVNAQMDRSFGFTHVNLSAFMLIQLLCLYSSHWKVGQ